jgi:hypothetical protein
MRRPPRDQFLFKRQWHQCHVSLAGFCVCYGRAAGGEDFRSPGAAGFGPFVVPLGKNGTGEADDGTPARKGEKIGKR